MSVAGLPFTWSDQDPPPAAVASAKRVVVIASLTRSLVNFRGELLAAMAAAGHEVTALAPDEDAQAITQLAKIGVAFRIIPMARTGTDPLSDLTTLRALHAELRRIAPDVTLAYTMKPIIYGGIAARMAGVGRRFSLFTGFGYVFSEALTGPRAAAMRRLSIWLYRAALVGSKAVFVYNDADAAEIRRHAMIGRTTPMIAVAGSGVDLDRFAASPPRDGAPVFLLIARLLREKGIAEFAAAARTLKSRCPDARFQILGPFDPSPLGVTPDEMERWKAEGAVEYLGETGDVVPYLDASTVFVLPSYYREGIPRSALEALAAGRPIITTDMPGCRDTVVDGGNGFCIEPRNADRLAEAMRAFIDDRSLAPRMGARSRRLAEERFDVRKVNATLLDALGLASGM